MNKSVLIEEENKKRIKKLKIVFLRLLNAFNNKLFEVMKTSSDYGKFIAHDNIEDYGIRRIFKVRRKLSKPKLKEIQNFIDEIYLLDNLEISYYNIKVGSRKLDHFISILDRNKETDESNDLNVTKLKDVVNYLNINDIKNQDLIVDETIRLCEKFVIKDNKDLPFNVKIKSLETGKIMIENIKEHTGNHYSNMITPINKLLKSKFGLKIFMVEWDDMKSAYKFELVPKLVLNFKEI